MTFTTVRIRGNDKARFESKIEKQDDGCWIFENLTTGGYGLFFVKGKHVAAHRWAYENYVGPIPEGHFIDHLCSVRPCVNPYHLEPVTPTENRRRWMSDRCSRGHDLTDPANVYEYNGARHCRRCRTLRTAAARADGYQRPGNQTECQRGHDLTDDANVYVYEGARNCRECRRLAYERYRDRKRAERLAAQG